MHHVPVDVWTSDSFVAEATTWVREAAAEAGLALTGDWEQPHARPWSSTIRFETDAGRLWFKVNGPGTRHEAALVGVLGRFVPQLVPEILAVEADRGWSLMRDAGPILRTVAEPDQQWAIWDQILPTYAEAQRALVSALPELRAAGMPDVGPAALPGVAGELIGELAGIPVEDGGLTAEQARGLRTRLPALEESCAELAASGIPDTVAHHDLHSANVCWSDAGARIIDWGDSVIGHPFGDMLGTLNSLAWHAKVERDDPLVLRARDVFLAAYSEYGSRDDLLRWVELARQVGVVPKALAWSAAFEGEPAQAQAEFDWPVREWLLDLLELDQLA